MKPMEDKEREEYIAQIIENLRDCADDSIIQLVFLMLNNIK